MSRGFAPRENNADQAERISASAICFATEQRGYQPRGRIASRPTLAKRAGDKIAGGTLRVRCHSRMSPELIEHFKNPRNVGELAPPAVTVEVSNPVCGDILRLSALIDNGRVVKTGFKVRGCTASIAAGSALTELITGRGRDELKGMKASEVEAAVGGLSNESKHAAALCIDAVRALLTQFPV